MFDHVYNPQEGWIISNYRVEVNGRLGDTTGPSVVRVGDDANVLSSQKISEGWKSLSKKVAELKSSTEENEEKVEKLDKLSLDINDEFDSWMSLATEFSSSRSGLHITGFAQAIWNDWLGIRIYRSGGKLDADVRIELTYIRVVPVDKLLILRYFQVS